MLKGKSKILSLLVILTLVLSLLLSACGVQNSDTEDSSQATNSNASSTLEDTNIDKTSSGETTLPIVTSPTTFTVWAPTSADLAYLGFKSYADNEYYKELEKRTGVHLDFFHPTKGQEVESLNLLFASGEYPDIVELTTDANQPTYPGGFDRGVSDGVILRLNELVDKHAPNYKEHVYSDPEVAKQVMTDTGNIVGFNMICQEAQPPWFGLAVRQDWLDDLGLETPVTYDDWYVMLKEFKEKKGAIAPMMLNHTGLDFADLMNAGVGVGSSFYQVDDKVKYGPIEPRYKDYLMLMNKWYNEGLIDQDFATKKDFTPDPSFISTGKSGAWFDVYTSFKVDKERSEDPNYSVVAVPQPVEKEGEQLHLRNVNTKVGGAFWSITSNCKDPETAVKWFDYSYTPEGGLLAGYGIEGISFEYGDDGEPTLMGDALNQMDKYVKPSGGGSLYFWERERGGNPQNILDAPGIWESNNDGSYVMPGKISPTVEEGNELASIMADIETYVNEMNVRYIMGAESFDQYDDFVSTIQNMNIERAIQIKQDALDRYNAR